MTVTLQSDRPVPPAVRPRIEERPVTEASFASLKMPMAEQKDKGPDDKKEPERKAPNRDPLVDKVLKNLSTDTGTVKWTIDDGDRECTLIVIRTPQWKSGAKAADKAVAVRCQDQVEEILAYFGDKKLKVSEVMLSTPATKEIADKVALIEKRQKFAAKASEKYGTEDVKELTAQLETAKKSKAPDAVVRELTMLVEFYEAVDSLLAMKKRDAVVRLAADGKVKIADAGTELKGDTIADRVKGDRGYAVLVVDGSRDVTAEIEKHNKANPKKRIHVVEVTPEQYPAKK